MSSIPQVSQALKTVFEHEAPALARAAGLRERCIPFAKLLYLLVLGWWQQPTAGPSALARFAGSLGLQVSKQAVASHFTQRTAEFLLAVLRRAVQVLVCAHPIDVPVLSRFRGVLLEDGSRISLPAALASIWRGCGGNATKDGRQAVHAVCDVLRKQVPVLVHGLMQRLPLQRAIGLVIESVSSACSIPARSARPSTSRLWLGASGPGLT